jgi:DNA helicase-2/ATP-dependent DNA helicase PcrA
MKFIADLHIHSPFSRATSKSSNLPGLASWARIKGIQVLGTGDFTHPGWYRQIREHLVPAEPGFFKLRDSISPQLVDVFTGLPLPAASYAAQAAESRFMLTAEISSIYKRHGKVRKVHNILFVPDFESVERINSRLAILGNIESDGRPILGLDSRNLLEILLELASEGFLVPAHIWTPWFSLFGSKSGFDAVEECFGDLTPHVFALETGLSSDPDMNRLVSKLDRYALISNSDCHSPAKLGREANIFNAEFSFSGIREALQQNRRDHFVGTIEFYPEEGKYHFDGHRKCHICFGPAESRGHNGICPVCQRPLTIGVTHRVMELADRTVPVYQEQSPDFFSLIPLPEVLGEILGRGPATKAVLEQYCRVVELFGSEFAVLFDTPIDEIETRYSPLLAEAVHRIRTGQVIKQPGYDGEFGVIRVFDTHELQTLKGQASLFGSSGTKSRSTSAKKPLPDLFEKTPVPKPPNKKSVPHLNSEQEAAVSSNSAHLVITAGPGTGKTHTLVARLVRLLRDRHSRADGVVAITFTNRAAEEIRARLQKESTAGADKVFVGTFHAFALHWLRLEDPQLAVIGNEVRQQVLKRLYPGLAPAESRKFRQDISDYFAAMATRTPEKNEEQALSEFLDHYLAELRRHNCIDLEEVLPLFVNSLTQNQELRRRVTAATSFLFIDEFQDLNTCQYELVSLLAARARIFAIGDPDQAIYGFRGSSPEFFFRFIKEQQADTIALTRNYRSAPQILTAASAVINNNPLPMRQPPTALRPDGQALEYYAAATPEEEAEFVVRRIEEAMGGISHFSINSGRGGQAARPHSTLAFSDIAVFYRLTQQAQALCKALERRGIPFQVVDAKPFFMQPQIIPVYFWLRIATGQGEMAEHLALLKYIKGIGPHTLQQLEGELLFTEADFFDKVSSLALPPKVKGILNELKVIINLFVNKTTKAGMVSALTEAYDWLQIDGNLPEAQRFLELAGSFGSDLSGLGEYLQRNATATVYDEQAESVSLMTIHAAKGLEFPMVFLTGVEENVLPCHMFSGQGRGETIPDDVVAEERRLFYVGLTRARDKLILTSAARRPLFGSNQSQAASRFLGEIPASLISRSNPMARKKKRAPTAIQMKLF